MADIIILKRTIKINTITMAKSGTTDRRSFIKSTGAVVIGSSIGLSAAFPETTFAQSKSVLKVALIDMLS